MDEKYRLILLIFVITFLGFVGIGIWFVHRAQKHFSGKEYKSLKSLWFLQKNYNRIRKISRIPCGVLYISATVSDDDKMTKQEYLHTAYRHLEETILATFCDKENMAAQMPNKDFVVLTRLSESKLMISIEQILQDVILFTKSNPKIPNITVNFGAYLIPASSSDFEEAIARAKLACKEAKKTQKAYLAWDYNLQNIHDTKITLQKSFQDGIEKNNFFLEFQPIIDISTGTIIAGEVLSRLSKDSNVIAPSDFVAAMQGQDIEKEFDYFVFEKTCQWISMHEDTCKYLKYISVNFSRNTLAQKGFSDKIIEIIHTYHISSSFVAIEIIENKCAVWEGTNYIIQNLQQLKQANICILLDDFGEGYTSFDDLKNYPVDIIKIGKTITDNLHTQIGLRIFKSMMNIARNMEVSVVCEGEETLEQIEIIRSQGVQYVQGFYYYRPVGSSEFEKAIANNTIKQGEN